MKTIFQNHVSAEFSGPDRSLVASAVKKYCLIACLCMLAFVLAAHPQTMARIMAEGGAVTAAAFVALGWPLLWKRPAGNMAGLIAFVGCDGTGKSTLSEDVRQTLSGERDAAICYLGLGSGELGNRIKRLPLIGAAIERRLSRKAKQARDKDAKIPGLATALVIYGFSLLRLRRFRRMLALREAGRLVLTDRYPQTEVAGFYDGPGLAAARAEGWAVAALARKEREIYEWMASYRPDLVIRLNIDPATAHARKPDHDLQLLARKADATAKLRFSGAPIVDIDSTQPYAYVRDAVLRVISGALKDDRRLP
ncbi:MAG: hypothetical protein QM605_15035 [Sphingobium sp.]